MVQTGQEIYGRVRRSVGWKNVYVADEKMHAKTDAGTKHELKVT